MTRGCEWCHAPEKAVSWVPASEQKSRFSELGEARRLCALRVPRIGWVESWRCKSSQHRKSVSLSPPVEKPLNSKRWIKVSYQNQKRVVRVFRIFRVSLCIFHVSWSYFRTWIYYIYLGIKSCENFLKIDATHLYDNETKEWQRH